MTLAEALSQYFSSAASSSNPYTHQELNKFARAIGPDLALDQLRPPEVANYAERVVAAGGDVHGRLSPIKEFLTFLRKEGLSSYSLAPHVKIPRASMKAAAQSKNAFESIPMTETGVTMLKGELDTLKGQRVDIVEAIRLAAADKDFRENAPLDAAKETQGKTEARIREIEEMLRRAVIMDTSADKSNRARVGSTVVLEDLLSGKNVSYTLVDSTEADPVAGKISVVSPVGKAVVGCRKGDEVKVQAPKGERCYKVSSIKF
ncbi:MAG: transcription elongation factor GreA [Dehalococcoidia bacterium]